MTSDSKVKLEEVWLTQGLQHGQQIRVGLISEGYRAQGSKEGRPMPVNVYDERFEDYLVSLFKQHVQNKYDNRVLLTGPSGTGKTTEAVTLAQKLYPDIPQDNICFRLKEFKARLNEMSPARPENDYYPAAVLDESGVDLFSHDWQKAHVIEFNKVFQIIRRKRLTMFCCLPHRTLLEKGIRDAMHWWCDMLAEHEYRGFAVARECCPNPWKPPFWRPMAAYTFDELKTTYWDAYEIRKDKFIKEFMSEKEEEKLSVQSKKLRDQRDSAVRELRLKGMSCREVGALLGIDDGLVSRIGNKPA